jgi:hypothetical protein
LRQKEREEEASKLNTLLKQLSAQLVEMENDVAASEAQCDDYEELIRGLREELAKATKN